MDRRTFCKGLFATALSLALPALPKVETSGNRWTSPQVVAEEALKIFNEEMRQIGSVINFTIKFEGGKELCLGKGTVWVRATEKSVNHQQT